jgi:hypothetical protein
MKHLTNPLSIKQLSFDKVGQNIDQGVMFGGNYVKAIKEPEREEDLSC